MSYRLRFQKHTNKKPKKEQLRVCILCKKEYKRNPKYSLSQWSTQKFCSVKCACESQKIKDGMSRSERHRRKKGSLKMKTPEWLERIKATTKESMYRPDVQEKIRQPKGPMSLEQKIIRSDALVGMFPKNMIRNGNARYPNIQRGTYECSKGSIYFRSKWEANYALYLDFLVKNGEIDSWLYEEDVFIFEEIKLGTRSYCPDFKIFNHDGTFEYHEVKGYMDSRSKTKLKRMEKYYPDVKLVLVERSFYNEILKKLKGVIRFY